MTDKTTGKVGGETLTVVSTNFKDRLLENEPPPVTIGEPIENEDGSSVTWATELSPDESVTIHILDYKAPNGTHVSSMFATGPNFACYLRGPGDPYLFDANVTDEQRTKVMDDMRDKLVQAAIKRSVKEAEKADEEVEAKDV